MCGKRKRCQKSTATVFGNVKLPQQLIKIICGYAVPTLMDQLQSFLVTQQTEQQPMTWEIHIGTNFDHEYIKTGTGFYKLNFDKQIENWRDLIVTYQDDTSQHENHIVFTLDEWSLPCSSCRFQRLCYRQILYSLDKKVNEMDIDVVITSLRLPTLDAFRGPFYLE